MGGCITSDQSKPTKQLKKIKKNDKNVNNDKKNDKKNDNRNPNQQDSNNHNKNKLKQLSKDNSHNKIKNKTLNLIRNKFSQQKQLMSKNSSMKKDKHIKQHSFQENFKSQYKKPKNSPKQQTKQVSKWDKLAKLAKERKKQININNKYENTQIQESQLPKQKIIKKDKLCVTQIQKDKSFTQNQELVICPLCFLPYQYGVEQRTPMMVCMNQHTYCLECLKSMELKGLNRCPQDQGAFEMAKIKKNRIIMQLLRVKKIKL